MRRGIHAISASPEIDAVEINLEDLVLRETMLEPQRQQRLLDLACEVALLCQEQILGELLGYRAAALNYTSGGNIGEGSPNEPDRIDPEMAVEAAIFGGDDGLRQVGRHFL